jgi:Fe2+ or Zn2+ uptake regulation protein
MGRSDPPEAPVASYPPLATYLEEAETRGLGWSRLRADVLRYLRAERRPCGAYEIARELGRTGSSRHAHSIYRSVRLLEKTGLVISVISRRAFLLVPDPKLRSWAVFLCSTCPAYAAVPARQAGAQLKAIAAEVAFRGRSFSMECLGRCCRCSA